MISSIVWRKKIHDHISGFHKIWNGQEFWRILTLTLIASGPVAYMFYYFFRLFIWSWVQKKFDAALFLLFFGNSNSQPRDHLWEISIFMIQTLCFCCPLLTFFRNLTFSKKAGALSECQTVWNQIRTGVLSVLICFQTVCKCYSQALKRVNQTYRETLGQT